jgi:hypothetical protein
MESRKLTQEQLIRDDLAFRADVSSRVVIDPSPTDLPPVGALVRTKTGLLAEILYWYDRNHEGTIDVSDYRMALVEIADGPVPDREFDEAIKQRFVFENEMTMLPNGMLDSVRRRLLRVESAIQ